MSDGSRVNDSLKNTSEFATSVRSKAEGIAFCIVFVLSSVSLIAGNLLSLVLFAVSKALHTKGFFLVMNMAIADLMLGAFSSPSYIYLVGVLNQLWKATHHRLAFYIFFEGVDNTFMFGSYLSAVFMSCERFHAVYWPFKHRSLSTKTYRIAIFILWTLAVSLSTILPLITFFISSESALYVYFPFVLSLTVILCVCNIAIWRNFQHQRVASHHQNRALQRKRLTKTLLFVSMLALLCWLPLFVLNFFKYLTETKIPWKFYYMVNILSYSNSFVNPAVYALRIPEFQQALRSCCRKRKAATEKEQTENRSRPAAPTTPETELRILSVNPTQLQEEFEQEHMETHL